jgi:nicotinamidase-related amidase
MNTLASYTIPDAGKSVLLTIDVQKDFTEADGTSPIPGTKSCTRAMKQILEAYRRNNLPIVHVIRLYKTDGTNADLCRRASIESGKRIVEPNSSGAELVEEFKLAANLRMDAHALLAGEIQQIGEREWLMYKPRWDAFHNTPLEEHLRSLKVTTVVIVGCNFPNCPRSTAYGASMRDFRVALVRDAISGIYERGLQELMNIAVETPTVEEWIRELDGASSSIAAQHS